jgi:hypothetical protein
MAKPHRRRTRDREPVSDYFVEPAAVLRVVPEEATAGDLLEGRIERILERGDDRDRAAERRDRLAERRPADEQADSAWIDREFAAEDRDRAAADRAALTDLLRECVRPAATES